MKTLPYVKLEYVKSNPQVEKLVPREIAYKYHALPISYDGKQITIAVPPHNNTADTKLLSSKIGLPVCFVQADPYTIDHRLEEIWNSSPERVHRLLFWRSGFPGRDEKSEYGEKIAKLLQASLYLFNSHRVNKETFKELACSIEIFQPDLIMIDDYLTARSGMKYQRFITSHKVSKLPESIMAFKNPRWPLRNLLLILTDSSPTNDAAIEWVSNFAQASKATVTILVLLPPTPLIYGHMLQHCVPALMRSNDPLGEKARWIAEYFSARDIKGTFRIRQGEPENQICAEINSSDPDLIFISGKSQGIAKNIFEENMVKTVLKSAGCPVVLSK